MGGENDTQLLIDLGRKLDAVGRDVAGVRERVASLETEQRQHGVKLDQLSADVGTLKTEDAQATGAKAVIADAAVTRRFVVTSMLAACGVMVALFGSVIMAFAYL